MSKLNDEIAKLNEQDTYSLMMFALFKLRNVEEYSSLSEMAYILDKKNFLNLCEYFGGMTIKIPTIQDIESILYPLLLYQLVDIDGKDYNDAISIIGHESSDLRKVKADYEKLSKILNQYSFIRSTNESK